MTKTAAGFSASVNAYRYTGKRLDTGSGTLDMGARRYALSTNRFLQVDHYHGARDNLSLSLDPLTANRYALAAGNPVTYVEMDGHYFAEGTDADGVGDGAPPNTPTDQVPTPTGAEDASPEDAADVARPEDENFSGPIARGTQEGDRLLYSTFLGCRLGELHWISRPTGGFNGSDLTCGSRLTHAEALALLPGRGARARLMDALGKRAVSEIRGALVEFLAGRELRNAVALLGATVEEVMKAAAQDLTPAAQRYIRNGGAAISTSIVQNALVPRGSQISRFEIQIDVARARVRRGN